VQVVIALVVTPEGFPLAYEAFSGNTSGKTTLKAFLEKIETLTKARRVFKGRIRCRSNTWSSGEVEPRGEVSFEEKAGVLPGEKHGAE
jgi:hypothetical protein